MNGYSLYPGTLAAFISIVISFFSLSTFAHGRGGLVGPLKLVLGVLKLYAGERTNSLQLLVI